MDVSTLWDSLIQAASLGLSSIFQAKAKEREKSSGKEDSQDDAQDEGGDEGWEVT